MEYFNFIVILSTSTLIDLPFEINQPNQISLTTSFVFQLKQFSFYPFYILNKSLEIGLVKRVDLRVCAKKNNVTDKTLLSFPYQFKKREKGGYGTQRERCLNDT